MSINVADKIQILKGSWLDKEHIIKIENANNETLWEYTEPTITGNDVLYVVQGSQTSWDKQPALYHLTNDNTGKIFFYKYSNFNNDWAPGAGYFNFFGYNAWSDGTDTYIGNYKYDRTTNTWIYVNWVATVGGTDTRILISGQLVWTDGTDIYYLAPDTTSHVQGKYGFRLNKQTKKWLANDDSVPPTGAHNGNRIWTDGTNVYYSGGKNAQYYWDKQDHIWRSKQWYYSDLLEYDTFDFYGDALFQINGTIYASWTRSTSQGRQVFFLNSSGAWEPTSMSSKDPSWITTLLWYGDGSFTDGTNTYITYSGNVEHHLFKIIETEPGVLDYQVVDAKSVPKDQMSYPALSNIYGRNMFSLGLNAQKSDVRARLYSTTEF